MAILNSNKTSSTIFDEKPKRKFLYKGSDVSSEYIKMPDGVRIAVDIMLPQNLEKNKTLPCILIMTKYWRSLCTKNPLQGEKSSTNPQMPICEFLNRNGYAVAIADARGTGASFGTWEYPLSSLEIKDFYFVGKWITTKEWSNGKIGALGRSYEGSTAEFLSTVDDDKILKAIVSKESEFDIYFDVAFPGGIRNEWFLDNFGNLNYNLDNNIVPKNWGFSANFVVKGVNPVSEDKSLKYLNLAIKDHKKNINIEKSIKGIAFRDDPLMPHSLTLDDCSFFKRMDKIDGSNIPMLIWASWMDGTSANSAIHKFLNLNNIKKIFIGSWSNNLKTDGNPYSKSKSKTIPTKTARWNETLKFFEKYINDEPTKNDSSIIYYYTIGEEKWKSTDVWPPDGIKHEKWFFNSNNLLSKSVPQFDEFDLYPVDFSATTGKTNRWHTIDGSTPVIYKNRKKEDQKLLVYTSEPFEEDAEITGHSVIKLNIKSTANDGAFYVYLEDVDEKGNVTYLTEGQLRGIHRRIANEEAMYNTVFPYHTFLREDAKPIDPGEVTNISFPLLPISALIKKGHRMRIAIAGHDANTFARIPKKDDVVISVIRDTITPSYIEIPIKYIK
jgi:putative CocE/NonD family hydrolase